MKEPSLKTIKVSCKYCTKAFVAKWRWGAPPKYCRDACRKAQALKVHLAWVKAHPERFRALHEASRARKALSLSRPAYDIEFSGPEEGSL